MVLTLPSLRDNALSRVFRWVPRVALWLVLAAVIACFVVVYTADGLPSPYGICYESRGRPMPCENAAVPPPLVTPALIPQTAPAARR